MEHNLIVSKSATIYYWSSTTAYRIGRARKLEKKRKRLDNTTYPSSSPSTTSYRYDRFNGKTDSNNTAVLSQKFDTSKQTRFISASDASTGSNYVSSSGIYQSTNHHGKMDDKDNDYSLSYETPQGGNCCSSSFGDIIYTTTTPQFPTLLPHVNNIYVSRFKGKLTMRHNVLNQ